MDLIDRQDAIDSIEKLISARYGWRTDARDEIQGLNAARCEIIGLPSAQKTGKWIECSASAHWKCSECGCRASYWFNEENSSSYDLDMSEWLSDYCPSCGAKMECEEE